MGRETWDSFKARTGGKSDPRQWRKGDRVRRAGATIATVIDDGTYIDEVSRSLWHFKVRFEDGTEGVWYPSTLDEVLPLP